MLLSGKVAIITGSGRGIGRGIALAFAREGAKVVVNSATRTCEKVADEIKALGGEVIPVRTDVSNFDEVKKMVNTALEKFGKIDVLVNNAGIFVGLAPLVELTDESWDRVFAVNLKGVFYCCKAVIPHMMERRSGKIINISSIDPMRGAGFPMSGTHYASSKAGVIALTKCLARELGPYGICVNSIAPGEIETDLSAEELATPEQRAEFGKQIPLGRVGQPEDVAKVAVFLASNLADYVTGEIIKCDGGWQMTAH